LLPDICSAPVLSEVEPGPVHPDWPATNAPARPLPTPPLLTALQQTYYDHETIELRVKLTDRPNADTHCPVLLEEVRDVRGNVRITQRTNPRVGCHYPQQSWRGPWSGPANEIPIQTGGNINWGVEPLGERTITILQVDDDPAPDGELRIVRSNSVTLNIVPTPHTCTNSDLDDELHFYRAPSDTYVAALTYRNVGDRACIFPIHFVNRQQIEHPLITLNAHETISSSVRWKTVAEGGETCEQLTQLPFAAMSLNYPTGLIVSPALLPKACSPLEQTDYVAGPFHPDWPLDTSRTIAPDPPSPVLIAPKLVYDAGEQIEWKVVLPDRDSAGAPCPVLLLSVRGGTQRSDQFGCEARLPYWLRPWHGSPAEIPIAIIPNGVRGLNATETSKVTVYRMAGVAPDGEVRMIASNTLSLRVVDPASISRSWGTENQGVRADLTLDQQVYGPDEDVPLHLAFENVSAAGPVYAQPPDAFACYDGGSLDPVTFTVQVRDQRGVFITPHFPNDAFMIEPHCVPAPHVAMLPSKLVPVETSLGRLGLLPQQPGNYTVTVKWSAYRGDGRPGDEKQPADPASISKTPFATVASSTVTLRIRP
jgi:hypothetical protein